VFLASLLVVGVMAVAEEVDRASMMGQDKGTQNIIKFTNRDDRQISLIAQYDQIDANTLKTGCEPFNLATGINADKQAAQSN
jgi:hypothetical protein